MKSIFLSIIIIATYPVFASSIEGTVKFKKPEAKGVLFIFAKKHNSSMRMPLAVKRIVNPKFPLKFNLSAQDAMVEGIPFEGPFTVTARLSQTGNAMDKSGPEGVTTKPIKNGAKDIKIEIK